MKVAVFGMGRLGAPMAAVFAASGAFVTGVDVRAEVIRALNAGRAPVPEPGLDEMIAKAGSRLRATNDYVEALEGTNISFVVVPTPSGEDRMFSLEYVIGAVGEIGLALRRLGGDRHVIVITSTVMPGSTLGPIRAALESSSALTVAKDVGLCYSPEFIALGSVIRDLTRPDMILLGESDPQSGEAALSVLSAITPTGTPVARMDPTSAEVTKLAVNTFVTTKISYANMLSEICERLPGADAQVVSQAIGLDSRIGSKYLKPGAPFGGPCFPRDNAALAALARSLGTSADIAEATDLVNRRQVDRVMALVNEHRGTGNRLAVLGLSYKPGTPVRDDSFGMALASRGKQEGFDVIAWEPTCSSGAITRQPNGVEFTNSLASCIASAEVAVIATPWSAVMSLPSVLAEIDEPRVIIDCWRVFESLPADNRTVLVHLGRGAAPIPNDLEVIHP
jgi:UDPglucose 6-dehydrogenase